MGAVVSSQRGRLIAVLEFAVVLSVVSGLAEQVIVYPSDDAMLIGNNGGGNYGETGSMYLRHQNATWGNNYSVAKFDLTTIPAGAEITSVGMRFYTGLVSWPESPTNFSPISVFQNNEDWDESSVTFNTAPAYDPTAVETTDRFMGDIRFAGTNIINSSVLGWLQFSGESMVELVQGWVDGSIDNFGVSVAATGDYLSDGRIFSLKTSEQLNQSIWPYIVIDYEIPRKGMMFSLLSTNRPDSIVLPEFEAFVEKAERGEPVVVAYLGGSITVGAITWPTYGTNVYGEAYDFRDYDRDEHSWRARTFEWLCDHYEQSEGQFQQVNAAIGGTPSLLGAYRLEQDVLISNPDLVFVEFAVNDQYIANTTAADPDSPRSTLRTYSSIVTRLREQNPDVVIFMPLSTHRDLDGSGSSLMGEAIDLSDDLVFQLAEKLRVPTVRIQDAFTAGRQADYDPYYSGVDTAGNYVHPAPIGHQIYAAAVEQVLSNLFATGTFEFDGDEGGVEPSPVSPTLVLPEVLVGYATGWTVETPETVEVPILEGHACLVGDDTNDVLEYTFTGSAVGLWLDSASSGTVAVQLDDSSAGSFSGRFSSIATGLDSSISHTIRLEPSPDSRILLRALTIDRDDT